MDKLIYLPSYHRISDKKLQLLKTFCLARKLELVVYVPILYPPELLISGDCLVQYKEQISNEWREKLKTYDLAGTQLIFEIVYVYRDFVHAVFQHVEVKHVISDRSLPLLMWPSKHRAKLLSLKDIMVEFNLSTVGSF